VAPTNGHETWYSRAERGLAHAVVAPKWRRHLHHILRREAGVSAVLFVNVPPNHLRGVADSVRREHRLPVLFYDGDVPASLPASRGFATGFRIYDGADLSEFDGVICNSTGGSRALEQMGARAVHTLHFGADPDLHAPFETNKDIDVFFYGHTSEYRVAWLRAMIAAPSLALPEVRFVVRGVNLGDLGRAELLSNVPFSRLRELVGRSRINLAITRDAHAQVYGSSTMRLFELAMMGACIVCNPCLGIEQWFEPGKELVVVHSEAEAIDRYRFLLAHEAERLALGQAARRRALVEHTFRHRASELVRLLGAYV
jgi:spore maturation protein CgeB